MFALFFSLYYAMFTGNWVLYNLEDSLNCFRDSINPIGTLLTSIFNNVATPYATLGTDLRNNVLYLVAFILALITCIGIVVMAVKGIKRIFGVFFYGVR